MRSLEIPRSSFPLGDSLTCGVSGSLSVTGPAESLPSDFAESFLGFAFIYPFSDGNL